MVISRELMNAIGNSYDWFLAEGEEVKALYYILGMYDFAMWLENKQEEHKGEEHVEYSTEDKVMRL